MATFIDNLGSIFVDLKTMEHRMHLCPDKELLGARREGEETVAVNVLRVYIPGWAYDSPVACYADCDAIFLSIEMYPQVQATHYRLGL